MKRNLDRELHQYVVRKFDENGIDFHSMANDVFDLQHRFYDDLTHNECLDAVYKVIQKRDVLQNIAVGIALDEIANRKELPEPLQTIVESDRGVFGVDELLATGIAQIFGTIGVSNYGRLDIFKTTDAKRLDEEQKQVGIVHTFLDDDVSAIIASACAKIAHDRETVEMLKADEDIEG